MVGCVDWSTSMASRNDPPPQSVGQALEFGWTYLSLRCALCRHTGIIELAKRPKEEGLARIMQRARCSRCRKTGGMVDAHIGMRSTMKHEKPITYEGGRVVRLGM